MFALAVSGRPNKELAVELGLSEMTAKTHRSQVAKKIKAISIVELVRMVDRLGILGG